MLSITILLRIVVEERQRVMQQHDPQNGGGDPSESSAASIRLTPPSSPAAASQGNHNSNKQPQKIWSKLALQRRQKLQDAQRQANQLQNRELRKKRLQKGWQSAKKAIHRVNIGRWIDDLERDQELADALELRNAEHREEVERRQIVMQVREACMDAMRMHLVSFLQECPEGSYEEWVAELHPDNISEHDSSVDQRFYVEDSDHRILWNEHHPNTEDHAFGFSKFVPASTVQEQQTAAAKPKNENVNDRGDNDDSQRTENRRDEIVRV